MAAGGDDWEHAAASPAPERRPPAADSQTVVETTASPMLLSEVHALAQGDALVTPGASEAGQEMSVEELIDLEQQAEFFVALGQDEAAIDLLMGHLRSSGGASPLPYLKLLEIYRRRNEREAYEGIRERFDRRFNAYAHEWQADPAQGRSLAEYPAVLGRLQALWAAPTQTLRALEALLFRQDAGAASFDLPAYRELLFLYAVARDLAEREPGTASVDLLLPLGADEPGDSSMTQLHATSTSHAVLDLDLTRQDGAVAHFPDFSLTSSFAGLASERGQKFA
jgi:hypothetical protein